MAVGVLIVAPNGTQEMYDKTMEELGLTAEVGDWPEGNLSHIAGPSGSDWIVVDTWESKEAFEKFAKERLMEAVQKAGFPDLKPQYFDIYLSHKA